MEADIIELYIFSSDPDSPSSMPPILGCEGVPYIKVITCIFLLGLWLIQVADGSSDNDVEIL